MRLYCISLVLLLSQASTGFGQTTDNGIKHGDFGITELAYEDQSDWDAVVQQVFGSEYRVADWTDLESYHESGQNILALYDGLGLTAYGASSYVTRDGDRNYTDTRYYYASRHEGNKPSNYLAHENIDNYTISLGSWWGSNKILAVKKDQDPSNDDPVPTSDNILNDSFENLNNWTLWGTPSSKINYNLGNPAPSFNNNGDPNYDSGALSIEHFDYSNGLIIEADAFQTDFGVWRSFVIGIAKEERSKYTSRFGSSCAVALRARHDNGEYIDMYIENDNGERETHSMYDLDNNWRSYKIIINPDLYVEFYKNDSLLYKTTTKLSLDYNQQPILLGSRSYNSNNVLIDNVNVRPYDNTNEETGESNLIAQYPFNGNAQDVSSNNYHATIHGASLTNDRFGNPNAAYEFDGIDDYMTAPDYNQNQPISMSFWLNTDLSKNGHIYNSDYWDAYWANYYGVSLTLLTDGRFGVQFGDGSYPGRYYSSSEGSIQPNTWNHIVAVWKDGGEASLYINGIEQELTPSGNQSLTVARNRSGNHGTEEFFKDNYIQGNFFFKGIFDDVSVYAKELSNQEIQELYGEEISEPEVLSASIELASEINSSSTLEIPENGTSYIYYRLASSEEDISVSTNVTIPASDISSSSSLSLSGMITESGLLQVEIPHSAVSSNATQIRIDGPIQTSSQNITLLNNLQAISVSSIENEWERTWSIFAEGTLGLGLTAGAGGGAGPAHVSVSLASASVSGSAGVGMAISNYSNGYRSYNRRFNGSLGAEIKVPEVEAGAGASVSFSRLSAGITTLFEMGDQYSFSALNLDQNTKNVAELGFMMETISLGTSNTSPGFGLLLSSIIRFMNRTLGVSQYFTPAKMYDYKGAGVSVFGTLGPNLSTNIGNTQIDFSPYNVEGQILYKFKRKNIYNQSNLTKYSFRKRNRVQSADIDYQREVSMITSAGLNFGEIGVNASLKNNSNNITNCSVCFERAEEIKWYSNFNQNNLSNIGFEVYEATQAGIRFIDVSQRSSVQYNFNPSDLQYINNENKAINSLKEIDPNALLMGLGIYNDAFSALENVSQNSPVAYHSFTDNIVGLNMPIGVSIEKLIKFQVGFEVNLMDQVSYPSKEGVIYQDVNLAKKEYGFDVNEVDEIRSNLLRDEFSVMITSVADLVEQEISEFAEKVEEVFEAGREAFVEIRDNVKDKVIGTVKIIRDFRGTLTLSSYSPNRPFTFAKAFQKPSVKYGYRSNNIAYKRFDKSGNVELVDVSSELVVISDILQVGLQDDNGNEVENVDEAFELRMIIDSEDLEEQGFSSSATEEVRIYRFNDENQTWIRTDNYELNQDTLSIQTTDLGEYALGIEINRQEDNTAPEINDFGPNSGTSLDSFPEIFAQISDDEYGSGINLAQTHILLNGDTLDYAFEPLTSTIRYQPDSTSYPSNSYQIRFIVRDNAGNVSELRSSFNYTLTDLTEEIEIPSGYELGSNYPNPFNPTTSIPFTIPEATQVRINIYDVMGRYIDTIFNDRVAAGTHQAVWNVQGSNISSGVYFYQIVTPSFNQVRKMTVVK